MSSHDAETDLLLVEMALKGMAAAGMPHRVKAGAPVY